MFFFTLTSINQQLQIIQNSHFQSTGIKILNHYKVERNNLIDGSK